MLIHIKQDGKPIREISLEQAKFEIHNKMITGAALYWAAGMKEWARLDQLPEIYDQTSKSIKEERLGVNWLYRQIDARRSFGDTRKLSSPTAKEKWLKALSITGLIIVYIFTCLLFVSAVITRDQNHNPLLGFLLGLILFRRIFRLQSQSVIINKQTINFVAYYFKASFLACLKWLLYLTPVYIFAIVDAETASDFGKNMGKSLGLYICTIVFAVDAPFWVWRKRNQFAESAYPEKNLAWAFVGGIGLPLSLIYLFAFFIPVFQNSMQRAQAVAEAAKFPKPRSVPTSENASSPPKQENMYSQNEEKPISKDDIYLLKAKAKQGDAPAQLLLGNRYFNGDGVIEDDAEAIKWFHKAAVQGNTEAQVNLGICYAIAGDNTKAVDWYRKAADQGVAQAQLNLGQCYAKGEGVAKDEMEAVKWYRKAAGQGLAEAQYNLGVSYRDAKGVVKNDLEAARWFFKAAGQGLAEAQHNLGVIYLKGIGVDKDDVEAYAFFSLAGSRLGQSKNAQVLLKKGMTSIQVEQGERRAKELQKQIDSKAAAK